MQRHFKKDWLGWLLVGGLVALGDTRPSHPKGAVLVLYDVVALIFLIFYLTLLAAGIQWVRRNGIRAAVWWITPLAFLGLLIGTVVLIEQIA